MPKPLGGRGKKAPYETVVIRVPKPIATRVEVLINQYRDILTSDDAIDREQIRSLTLVSYTEASKILEEILKSKKSARQTGKKLLQVLFTTNLGINKD